MPLMLPFSKALLIVIGTCLAGLAAPAFAQDGIGDQIQPLLMRYCKLVPGNWRRTVAVLSLMPPERLQGFRLPFEDVGMTEQCAETVRDMMCSANYVNALEGLLKEVYKIPELDKKMMACGVVGGIFGLATEGSLGGAFRRGGDAMTACGIVFTLKSVGGCARRKEALSKMADQIQWPQQVDGPARFELEALRNIDASALAPDQKALIYAEIEARYQALKKLPNTMGNR